jgi:hypothetical protein
VDTTAAPTTSTVPPPPEERWIRFERVLRAVTVVVLTGIVLAASMGRLGVQTATARAANSELAVEVEHARVARPGLAAPLVVTVSAERGALPPTIVIEVPTSYLAIYDEHSIHPWPARESSTAAAVRWEVEVEPEQDRARVTIDGRIDPAEVGRRAAVVQVEATGREPVSVPVGTSITP